MVVVDCMGDVCPVPVVKTKNAVRGLAGADTVKTLVDNETSVANLRRMAQQMGWAVSDKKTGEGRYEVEITLTGEQVQAAKKGISAPEAAAKNPCPSSSGTVVVISSRYMGTGDDALGDVLMKSFVFSLTQLDTLPETVLFYNGGAFLTCEGSPVLEDLKKLESQGVRIQTCGTCLNHYGIKEKLQVGEVTNMYAIVETQAKALRIIRA